MHLVGAIDPTITAGTFSGTLMLGGTKIFGGDTSGFTATATTNLLIDVTITFNDTDATGSVSVEGTFKRCPNMATCTVIRVSQTTSSINFTNNLRLQFAGKFNTSNGGNNAVESSFNPFLVRRKY